VAAEYPDDLASFVTLTPGEDGTTMDEPGKSGTEVVTKIHEELAATQATLGTNPAGAAATVAEAIAGKAAAVHSHPTSDVSGLDSALSGKEAAGTAATAVAAHAVASDPHGDRAYADAALATKADLVGGVLPTSQLPALAVTEHLGSVANESAMLALSGQKGDWCIRSDVGQVYVITGADPSLLASWTALAYPTSPVSSVNGETGVVVLSPGDVGADPAGTAAALVDDLSGVTDAATARSNLGLGSAAVADTADFEAAGAVSAHTGDTSDAHDASAISVDASGFAGNLTTGATDVQSALDEIDALELGGGSSAGVVTLYAGTSSPSGGSDGDWALHVGASGVSSGGGGTGDLLDGRLWSKRSGTWYETVNSAGMHAHVPVRKSHESAGIVPGYKIVVDSTWITGTVPTGLDESGLSVTSGNIHATTGGTWGYLAVVSADAAAGSSAGMSFFSFATKIVTLPDAGRYLYIGQMAWASDVYGIVVKVDSSGTFTIYDNQGAFGETALSDTGTGVAAGSYLVVERFGNRMTAYRSGASDKKLNSKVEAYVGTVGTYSGNASKSGWGFATNSNTLRMEVASTSLYG
jgi:hypothetical protein